MFVMDIQGEIQEHKQVSDRNGCLFPNGLYSKTGRLGKCSHLMLLMHQSMLQAVYTGQLLLTGYSFVFLSFFVWFFKYYFDPLHVIILVNVTKHFL